MKVTLELERNMRIIGKNKQEMEVYFDTSEELGGENSAPKPMEVFLMAMGACTFMDTISILRKKRKTIEQFKIKIEAERKKEHPMVFSKAHLIYELVSPDAELSDLNRAVELSQTKYCSASAMFKAAGCEITWETVLNRP
ncbi:MAG: OsmC family protein [Ignavibacteria bacterium]|nr:OsmC family protein [Ignavibacteria bacterium]